MRWVTVGIVIERSQRKRRLEKPKYECEITAKKKNNNNNGSKERRNNF
jgi:hypothetical protein